MTTATLDTTVVEPSTDRLSSTPLREVHILEAGPFLSALARNGASRILDDLTDKIKTGVRYLISIEDADILASNGYEDLLTDTVEVMKPAKGTVVYSIKDSLTRTEAYKRAIEIIETIERGEDADPRMRRKYDAIIRKLAHEVVDSDDIHRYGARTAMVRLAERKLLPKPSVADIVIEATKDIKSGIRVVAEVSRRTAEYIDELKEAGVVDPALMCTNPSLAYA